MGPRERSASPPPLKHQVGLDSFSSLDIRVGRIVDVAEANTKKPLYRITVDFGPEIGRKVSCGGFRRYAKEALLGKQVVAVVNLPPKQMGPETSEVLILAALNERGEPIYLTPEAEAPPGSTVF